MSSSWVTVGKNNKPLRKIEKPPVAIREPKKPSKVSHGVPKGPPKKASLLGIPAELRLKIWEDCLPSEEIVNVGLHHVITVCGWND